METNNNQISGALLSAGVFHQLYEDFSTLSPLSLLQGAANHFLVNNAYMDLTLAVSVFQSMVQTTKAIASTLALIQLSILFVAL